MEEGGAYVRVWVSKTVNEWYLLLLCVCMEQNVIYFHASPVLVNHLKVRTNAHVFLLGYNMLLALFTVFQRIFHKHLNASI